MRHFRLVFFIVITIGLLSCNRDKQEVKQETSRERTKENRIFDKADLLTKNQEDSTFILIKDLEKNTGSQIAVITIDTLNGVDINEYSNREFEKLNLGRDLQKDGILLTVALKDKSVRIEVGYGLEKVIKDEIAARIIQNVLLPKFREAEYGQGIYNGVDTIKLLIEKNKDLVGQML